MGLTTSGGLAQGTLTSGSNVAISTVGGSTSLSVPNMGATLIGFIKGADMTLTSDQALTMAASGIAKYIVTNAVATNASATPGLAAGTIYTAASKGGTALYGGTTTTYTGLSAATKVTQETMTASFATTAITSSQLYLSLTTANGTALTCDFYVYGIPLP